MRAFLAVGELNYVEFISAGPGDPELLTLAGARRLEAAGAVLAPALLQESFAHYLQGKTVETPFQMPHEGVISWVEKHLSQGPVAFLVPGDSSSFSPFQSFIAHFAERARVTPGVGSHAAAAALLRKSFDLPGVAQATILTSPRAFSQDGGRVSLREYARPGHTLVLYMNDMPLSELVTELRAGYGKDVPVAVLERISCPDERVTLATAETLRAALGEHDPFTLREGGAEPRLALIVVGDVLTNDEDPSWWNRRYETLWKPRGTR